MTFFLETEKDDNILSNTLIFLESLNGFSFLDQNN